MFIHHTNKPVAPTTPVTLKGEVAKSQHAYFHVLRTIGTNLTLHYEFNIWFRQPDFYKETLFIPDAYFASLLEEVSNQMKGKKGYVSTTLTNEGIDHCTSDTDMYEVPCGFHQKGDRKVRIGSESFGYIPKGWETRLVITFKDELSGRMRNSILSELLALSGMTVTTRMKEDLKRHIDRQNPTPGCIDRFSTVFRQDLKAIDIP